MHDSLAGQAMVGGHGDVVDRYPGQGHGRHPARLGDRAAQDARCQPPRAQAIEDEQRGETVGSDDGVGVLGPKRPDGPHHAVLAAVAVADGARRRHRGELGRRGVEAVDGSEHVAGVDQQPLAGPAQCHPPARALEQRQAEVALELADAL